MSLAPLGEATRLLLAVLAIAASPPAELAPHELDAVLLASGWHEEIDAARCVTYEETKHRTNPEHVAGDPYGGSWGLWQINGWWATEEVRAGFPRFDISRADDPLYVSQYARLVWLEVGWSAWPNTAYACGLL